MKDIGAKVVPPKDAIYKDVVIIGNGPSGISLSYMLSGHWPYWISDKIDSHPDELLRARLNFSNNKNSLVQQDLMTLADGLEGRSTNPVSLLLDSLQNPCADLGMELPSMLEYKYHPEKQIDHVVLGKGLPGGSWHRMDPNLRTLSLSAWMSLPGLDYTTWELAANSKKSYDHADDKNNDDDVAKIIQQLSRNCQKCTELQSNGKYLIPNKKCDKNNFNANNNNININNNNNNEYEIGAKCCQCSKRQLQQQQQQQLQQQSSQLNQTTSNEKENVMIISNDQNRRTSMPMVLPRRNLSLLRQVSKEVQTRALVSRVAEYYQNYVSIMDLKRFFVCDTIVTAIVPIQSNNNNNNNMKDVKHKAAKWIVYGTKSNGRQFSYVTKNVVLANGASDLVNRLGIRGENTGLNWIKYELPQLEVTLETLTARERSKLKPVLVVGAGLSAADAVTICRSSEVPVIHVYRNKSAGLDKMLPENVYPEYHAVHKMMKESTLAYDLYTPLAEHTIIDLQTINNAQHRVTVQHLITGETKQFDVSFCTILIGSRPDLRFLSQIGASKQRLTSAQTTPSSSPTPPPPVTSPPSSAPPGIQTSKLIEELNMEDHWSLLTRKMTWLKNLCAKCKHLNVCEWSRRNEYKKICDHNFGRSCECATRLAITKHHHQQNQHQQNQQQQSTIEDVSHFYRTPAEENYQSINRFGEDPTKPIDCKSNPINVDKYTNAVRNAPSGLYAMGPLVGDNFVRFIPGGALAITSALYKEND